MNGTEEELYPLYVQSYGKRGYMKQLNLNGDLKYNVAETEDDDTT